MDVAKQEETNIVNIGFGVGEASLQCCNITLTSLKLLVITRDHTLL
jgi:hypothetical protein